MKKIKYLGKVKKDTIKMLKICKTLYTDLKTIYNHNSYKKKWQGEYAFSGRDNYSGEHWNVKLKDIIEEMFNENTCRVCKFQ